MSDDHVIAPDYVVIIREIFEERKNKNPQYSLRAFAKSLEIDASSLSAILSCKRALPLNRIDDFVSKLKLSDEQSAIFAQSLLGRATSVIRNTQETNSYKLDGEEFFSVIAEWEYFAVLSLTNLKDFEPSSEWISQRLGILQQRASEVLERLQTLQLLEYVDGEYRASYERIKTTEDLSNAALRMAHLEELDLVRERALKIPINDRHLSSLTMSIKKEDLLKAFALIRSFRRQMEVEIETLKNADEVYQLAIQFYPLTR